MMVRVLKLNGCRIMVVGNFLRILMKLRIRVEVIFGVIKGRCIVSRW